MEDCPTCNQPIYNVRGAIADMTKLRAECDRLLLQLRAVVDLVPHTVGAHTEGFPCDGCVALKKLGIERTSIFEKRKEEEPL